MDFSLTCSYPQGTIASAKYGVAKKATIIAVKVLGAGGSGTMSDVVMGVSWAADAASDAAEAAAQGKNKGHKGSVANMSLGGGKSQALDDAVDAAVDDGLHFAVAAGNDNKDACAYSPASSVNAITVGASAISDERAYFSNHGKCVDIFAPGLNILSTWNTGKTSTNTISGTS
jgi:cerevisin